MLIVEKRIILIVIPSTFIACSQIPGSGTQERPSSANTKTNKSLSDLGFQQLPVVTHSFSLSPEQQQCVVNYPNLKAENIKAGVTIAGVEGTATALPACSETLRNNCIATEAYPAINTEGLADKVLAGQTVAGVAGTSIEAKVDCNAANQTDCVTTSAYMSIDLSAKDADGALDLSNASFETRVKDASTFEYWDENGARHTNSGDGDIVAANINSGVEIFSTTGTANLPPACSSISVGGTWILVPGNSDYGTNDFCVMKYEAKCSLADGTSCTASASTQSPTSTVANTPWVSIDQQDAKTECASLGKGYHLITNDEWMTIATNVAAQSVNWNGGTVGTNELTRGHSDDSPSNACAANASDANAYVETDCTGSSSGTFNQRRTVTLSNGEVIWDLSGNVYEWTSYFNDEEKPTPNGNIWNEYTAPIVGTTTMPLTDLIPQVAITNLWDSNEGLGWFNAGPDGSGGALARSGDWGSMNRTGVFLAYLNYSSTEAYSDIGFRCAVSVP